MYRVLSWQFVIHATGNANSTWNLFTPYLSCKRTMRVTECTPREWTRRQGRPATRWRDNLGPAWPRIARDRRLWRQVTGGVPPSGVKETLVVTSKCRAQIMLQSCILFDNFVLRLKLIFRQYPAIHTNYSLSNCTISN